MRNLARVALLIGSLAWAAVVLVRADLGTSWEALWSGTSGAHREWLLLFLAPSLLAGLADTQGWIASFGKRPERTGFAKLFSIRLAGEALNQATPFMSLGGEPVKALLLAREGDDRSGGAASVMAARLGMTLTQIAYVLVGVALCFFRLPARGAPLSSLGVFPVALGAVLLALLLYRTLLPKAARRFVASWKVLDRHREAVESVREALGFWRTHPRQAAAALGWFLAGWMVIAAEFSVVARVFGVPLRWADALALEGLMNSITMATFFIPGNLGSQETGLLYLTGLFGLGGPFGAVIVILRRAREILWITLGFGCLALVGGRGGVPAAAGRSGSV